jgi:hypothetical protein
MDGGIRRDGKVGYEVVMERREPDFGRLFLTMLSNRSIPVVGLEYWYDLTILLDRREYVLLIAMEVDRNNHDVDRLAEMGSLDM